MILKKNLLIAFVPVLHRGYLDLIEKRGSNLAIFGREIIDSYSSLLRDIRCIDPDVLKKIIEKSDLAKNVQILSFSDFKKIGREYKITMIDDDVSRDIAKKYLKTQEVVFEKVFLRWDWLAIEIERENVVSPDRVITKKTEDRKFINLAKLEAEGSSDWWRQIGAVAVKDGKVLLKSHNRHLPTDFHLSVFGDPRVNFNKGERLDIYTSIHGEADIIAKSAKKGLSLKGTSIYVTTFPCSNCARLMGEAGIKKLFYSKGYSRLDAEQVLKAYGIEIILVQ